MSEEKTPPEEDMTDATTSPADQPQKPKWIKLVVLMAILAIVVTGYVQFGDSLTLESLAGKESELRDYQLNNPVLVYGVAFAIYVAVTGFSLPGALPMTLVFGWFFGAARGVLLVSFASTLGATLAFLMSRYVLRESIQSKFGDRLQAFNEALDREGAFYLFSLRLIPAVPFFVINLVMGLTRIRTWTYWWVSQVGMLPGTIVFIYAGSEFPDLQTLSKEGASLSPQLIFAFVAIAVFPFAVKAIMKKVRPPQSPSLSAGDGEEK